MKIGLHYLSPEGDAAVRAAAKKMGEELAARRILRDTARRLDVDLESPTLVDRRSANDRRSGEDRRFHTMKDKLAAVADRFGRDRRFEIVRHSAFSELDD